MKLSIVATLYNSSTHVLEFYKRVSDSAQKIAGNDYEIILVNDGSPDNSLDIAVEITKSDSKVIVIDLSRNFGHYKAIMTGLAHTKGRQVFLIDSDLEEDPEWLNSFATQMGKKKCDVVYGTQKKRKGKFFERLSGGLFYWFFNIVSGVDIPANAVTARLLSRRYVDALLLHDEREIFLAGLWQITGFTQIPYIVDKHHSSRTTYTFRRKISVFVDSITSFSNTPLIAIFYIGATISCLSIFYIIYLLINWYYLAEPQPGWTSVIASLWLLGGMIISFIGVIGIYLSKVFSETKRRPSTIIRQIYVQK